MLRFCLATFVFDGAPQPKLSIRHAHLNLFVGDLALGAGHVSSKTWHLLSTALV